MKSVCEGVSSLSLRGELGYTHVTCFFGFFDGFGQGSDRRVRSRVLLHQASEAGGIGTFELRESSASFPNTPGEVGRTVEMTWPDLMARNVGIALIWLVRGIVSSGRGATGGDALFRCDGLLAVDIYAQEVYLRRILCERRVLGRDGLRIEEVGVRFASRRGRRTHLAGTAPFSVEVYYDCSSSSSGGAQGFVPLLDRVDLSGRGHGEVWEKRGEWGGTRGWLGCKRRVRCLIL